MTHASWVVIALAITTGTAVAQPGNTPPVEPSPPGAGAEVQAGADFYVNPEAGVDDLIARVQAASPTLETVARGTFRRARRVISFGPTAGLWLGAVPAQDDSESALTFGLGLELFKVPVFPGPETLKALVIERAKAKLKDQLRARFRGQPAPPIEAEQLAREIWEEAVKEVLGLENIRPKTMERPRLTAALEVNKLFRADAWMPRVRLGVGVWKVTLAGSFGVATADGTPVYTGVELVTHFLVSKNPRASVMDVFLRADFEVRHRDTNTDQLVLGARFLLDVI